MAQIVVQKLRDWRVSNGLTLHEAAARVGTSRQVWSDWERGRRRPSGHFMPLVREATEGVVTADDFYSCDRDSALFDRAA